MTEREETPRPLHENLDTAYVNVAALLEYLEARGFEGLVRLVGEDFEAEVVMRAGERRSVRARDGATGERLENGAALEAMLAHARKAGGLVSVYEGAAESFVREEA